MTWRTTRIQKKDEYGETTPQGLQKAIVNQISPAIPFRNARALGNSPVGGSLRNRSFVQVVFFRGFLIQLIYPQTRRSYYLFFITCCRGEYAEKGPNVSW